MVCGVDGRGVCGVCVVCVCGGVGVGVGGGREEEGESHPSFTVFSGLNMCVLTRLTHMKNTDKRHIHPHLNIHENTHENSKE